MIHQLTDLWLRGWRSLVEILLLWVAIYTATSISAERAGRKY